jgi:hypothetical protein
MTRPDRLRTGTKASSIFGLIATGFFVLILVTISLPGLYRDEQFDQSTSRSQGTIEQEWTTYGSKSGIHYHVRYHFADDHGRLWTIDTQVAPGTYPGLEDDPRQTRIDGPVEAEFHWHKDKVLFGVPLVVALFLLLIVWSNHRRRG